MRIKNEIMLTKHYINGRILMLGGRGWGGGHTDPRGP